MPNKPTSLASKITKDILFGTSYDLPKVLELALEDLEPNPDQPRKFFDEKALEDLANSINDKGLISPITVQKKTDGTGYIIVAGERRFRAHKLLDKTHIWAINTDGNPDELAMIENLQRENLDPIEEAEGLARLVDRHQWTHEELGKAVGKARNTVTATLRLNSLPDKIKEEYRDNGVSKSVLIELSQVKDPEGQVKFWEQIKKGNFKRKDVRAKKTTKAAENLSGTQAVTAGKIFIKKLSNVQKFEKDNYEELLKIQEDLGNIISNWPLGEDVN